MNKKRKNKLAGKLLIFFAAAIIFALFVYGSIVTNGVPHDTANLKTRTDENVNIVRIPTDGENGIKPYAPKGYERIEVNSREVHFGELILVNNDNAFISDGSPVYCKKEMPERIYPNNKRYALGNASLMLNKTTVEKLNEMFEDYYKTFGTEDIYINAAYRTVEEQTEILGSKGSDIAAQPGCSEHHSGYAFDIAVHSTAGYSSFTGEGNHKWIFEHCADYGFILRYPDGKKNVTGIDYEPWHYRYVGVPHSTYIYENGLCLEEYTELLRSSTDGENHLSISSGGKDYEVYCIPADAEENKTVVFVPEDREYTISGNNKDGFIVTVLLTNGEKTEEEAPEDSQTENADASAQNG